MGKSTSDPADGVRRAPTVSQTDRRCVFLVLLPGLDARLRFCFIAYLAVREPCIFAIEFTCTGVEFTPALLGPSEPGWYRSRPTLFHSPEAQVSFYAAPSLIFGLEKIGLRLLQDRVLYS